MAESNTRNEVPQTPTALRNRDERGTNYVGNTFAAHDEYSVANNADMEVEASADYGEPIRVLGYDFLTLFLDHVAGTATTEVHVDAQVSFEDGGTQDAVWFDLMVDESNDGVLVRKVWDWTTSVDGLVAFEVPTEGRRMRFKVWAIGGDLEDSRALLTAMRLMRSL